MQRLRIGIGRTQGGEREPQANDEFNMGGKKGEEKPFVPSEGITTAGAPFSLIDAAVGPSAAPPLLPQPCLCDSAWPRVGGRAAARRPQQHFVSLAH